MAFVAHFTSLPLSTLSIQRLLHLAVEQLDPERVILFGSRARGDHRVNSDFDIAFKGIQQAENWSRFLAVSSETPNPL